MENRGKVLLAIQNEVFAFLGSVAICVACKRVEQFKTIRLHLVLSDPSNDACGRKPDVSHARNLLIFLGVVVLVQTQ